MSFSGKAMMLSKGHIIILSRSFVDKVNYPTGHLVPFRVRVSIRVIAFHSVTPANPIPATGVRHTFAVNDNASYTTREDACGKWDFAPDMNCVKTR